MAHALLRAASALLPTPFRERNCAGHSHYLAVVSRRRLPHVYPEDRALFVTWHLHGGLPAPLPLPPRKFTDGQAFVWLDRRLDSARNGPMYLRQPAIAQIVVDSIHKGVELAHFELGAYVIVPNHVHLLILPKIAPDRVMKSLKGATAREANRLSSSNW